MDTFKRALHFAIDAYGDLLRKGDGSPMVLHAMEAAAIAASMTNDYNVLAAAALHDVVEDTDVPAEEIIERFGPRVAQLVIGETEDKRPDMPPSESWMIRKQETIDYVRSVQDEGMLILVLSDKLSNIRSMCRNYRRQGESFWQRFNQKDPAKHHWYYSQLRDALAPLKHTAAWQEYDSLIRQVFEKDE